MLINPVFVSPLAYPLSQYLPYGNIGAFPHNTDLWIVASETASNSGPLNLVAYKSTDSGATWTRVIAGPTILGGDIGSASWSGAGNNIVCSYRTTGGGTGKTRAVVFDMASETFGTAFAVPFEPSPSGASLAAVLLELSTTDLALVWQEQTGPSVFVISVAIYNGAWSSQLDVGVSTANKRLRAAVVDGSDRVGILWQDGVTFLAPNTYSLTSGTTLVSETAAFNGRLTTGNGLNVSYIGTYDAATDSVIFPVQRPSIDPNPPGDDLYNISLIIGTPTATPAFSTVDVYTLDETGTTEYLDFPWLVITPTGYSVIWGHGDHWGLYADGDFELFQSDSATLAGPWPAPTTIFDIQADHFPTDPFTDNLELLWVNALPDGTINITSGMVQIVLPADNWCGVLGFFALEAAPAPPELACPVDGGTGEVGVPYDKTLVVTGGSGSFEFSIIGGELPPGLTLNPDTGEISGTPTTPGTFCYTAQVVDTGG